MTNGHAVPEDFPQETQAGSPAGSSPKLLLRKVDNRYCVGLAPDELREWYEAAEYLAQQLAVYTQRKIDTKRWDFDEALRRVELGVENKVRSGAWDFSAAEISWLMSRTRQIMTDAGSRAADEPIDKRMRDWLAKTVALTPTINLPVLTRTTTRERKRLHLARQRRGRFWFRVDDGADKPGGTK